MLSILEEFCERILYGENVMISISSSFCSASSELVCTWQQKHLMKLCGKEKQFYLL